MQRTTTSCTHKERTKMDTSSLQQATAAPCTPHRPACLKGVSTLVRTKRQRSCMQMQSLGPAVSAAVLETESTAPVDTEIFTREDFDNFMKGWQSQLDEAAYWVDPDDIEGTVPGELEGTLLRNGPGLFEIGERKISQPLDGDGQVSLFAIKDGRVFFRNKFVRTEALMREQEAQKMLYRGAFSVGNPAGGFFFNPFDFAVKGIANTSVLEFGGKLLALYERDLPYELDAELKTIGPTDLGCSIDTPKFFGAHLRVEQDADGGERLVGFNASEEPTSALLNFFEYDSGFRLLNKVTHRLQGASFGFFHDMLVTPNYYVLVENPITLDLQKLLTRYMFGRACLAECLEFRRDRRTRVHLLRRPGRQGVEHAVAETEPFFSFHHVNAFEAPGGKVVVDTCAMTGGIAFDIGFEGASEKYYQQPAGRATLTRLVVDVAMQQMTRHALVPERAAELPSPLAAPYVGRPHTHQYLAASRVTGQNWGPQQGIMKVSVSPEWGVSSAAESSAVRRTFWFPADRSAFAQEPIFVARGSAAAEDDGWVLTLLYSAAEDRTSLVILDAQSMEQVAAVRLRHNLPYGIHGSWTSTYLGPPEEFRPTMYNIKNGVSANGRPKYAK